MSLSRQIADHEAARELFARQARFVEQDAPEWRSWLPDLRRHRDLHAAIAGQLRTLVEVAA